MKALKALILAAACSSFLSVTSFADEFGTKEEAAALLERAIALVRIDKNRALDLFTSGEGGLIQKDLYVFCFAPDGTVIAHPNIVGLNTFDNDFVDVSLSDNHVILNAIDNQNGGPITATITADDLNRRLTISDSFEIIVDERVKPKCFR